MRHHAQLSTELTPSTLRDLIKLWLGVVTITFTIALLVASTQTEARPVNDQSPLKAITAPASDITQESGGHNIS